MGSFKQPNPPMTATEVRQSWEPPVFRGGDGPIHGLEMPPAPLMTTVSQASVLAAGVFTDNAGGHEAPGVIAAPALIAKPLTPEQEAERATWQYRAIARLQGNRTLTGMILLSALGRVPSNPPWVGMHAVIDEDGEVWSDFVGRDRKLQEAMHVCSAEILAAAFKRVADDIDATDAERVAMFAEVRKWISKDMRAINNVEGDHD